MASSQQGSSKLWILVAVLLLIILAATATITWLIVERPARAGEELGISLTQKTDNPLFVKLEPFTVNLQSGDYGSRLLYVGITLDLGNEQTMNFIQGHLPQVRNRLLMVLSGQDATALITSEGKRKLATQIGTSLHEPFTQQQPKLVVNDVLFTQFIVQ